jgi:nucleoside phosphorylase
MATQKIIDTYKVEKILNYGAVGGTDVVKLFDVVLPNKFYFHDVETP